MNSWEEGLFDFSGEAFNADTSLESLFLQKAAKVTREANLRQARALYRAALERVVAVERASWGERSANPDFRARQEEKWKEFLSEDAPSCVVAIQPLFPCGQLIGLPELQEKTQRLATSGFVGRRFLGCDEITIPGGLLLLDNQSAALSRNSQQIKANGFVYDVGNCVYTDKDRRIVAGVVVAERLVLMLRVAHRLFRDSGFEGDFALSVALEKWRDGNFFHFRCAL